MKVKELIEILRLLPEDSFITADNSYGDQCSGLWITYHEPANEINISKHNKDTFKLGGYVDIAGFTGDRKRYPKGVHLSQNIKWLQEDKEKPYKEKKKYLYSELSEFIKRAQQRGFATFDELREALPLEINDRYDIDSVFSILDEVRVKIIPTRDIEGGKEMIWKYINRDEMPEHGDFCLFVTHFGKSYHVGRYSANDNAFISDDKTIHQKEVFKWINIDEIHDRIECDDDGREHDYEMFPAHLYVTGIKYDPENGETEYSLKSKTINVDYANTDDDAKLFDAAKRRMPIVAEFKYVGGELHIRNVEIIEHSVED